MLLIPAFSSAQDFKLSTKTTTEHYNSPLPARTHDTATKKYGDSTGSYLIKYLYDWRYSSVPAVEGAEPHYDAMITVYQLIRCRCPKPTYDTVQIGQPFGGTFVRGGCFEDVPENWVKKAKAAK